MGYGQKCGKLRGLVYNAMLFEGLQKIDIYYLFEEKNKRAEKLKSLKGLV